MKFNFVSFVSFIMLVSDLSATQWSLSQAIDRTLENNPDVLIAAESINSANAQIQQARAAFRPQVNLHSGYISTDAPMNAFGMILNQRSFDFGLDFNDPGRMDDLNLSATVSLPLYTGGQRSAQLNSAKSQSRS
ncbi:MAG: TolC family protein, partial [Opitutales bacterium]|nr:TolC family protein [Opitutales bacterium]